MLNSRARTVRSTTVLLVLAFVAGCKVSEGGRADTALPVNGADSSAIRDKSLRPPPEGAEPSIALHGMPAQDSAIYVRDTIPAFIPDSALTQRAIEATKLPGKPTTDAALVVATTDLDVLRNELAVPIGNLPASALHDTYSELRGGTRSHEALDILAPRGTPVLSAAKGHILKLFNSKPGGLMVYAADSSGRFILLYGHLDAYAPGLADGQLLAQGQPIGIVGTTGNAPANTPHLHFAIARAVDLKQWWKGTPVNPYPLLRR